MTKIPTLTDRELKKFIIVLGLDKVKYLHVYGKIMLSAKQVDYLCSISKEMKA